MQWYYSHMLNPYTLYNGGQIFRVLTACISMCFMLWNSGSTMIMCWMPILIIFDI